MKTQHISNEEVMQGCLNGRKAEWKEFWLRYAGVVYSFPRLIFGFSDEDCREFYTFFQDQLYEGLIVSSYSPEIPFFTWLFTVLRSSFVKFFRQINMQAAAEKPSDAPEFSLIAELRGFDTKNPEEFPNCSRLLAIEKAFFSLKPADSLILKIHLCSYFYLTEEDILLIQEKSGLSLESVYFLLQQMKNDNTNAAHLWSKKSKDPFTMYLNTLHLERRVFSLYTQLEEHEAQHNFDIRLLENIENQKKLLRKQIEKTTPDSSGAESIKNTTIPHNDICCRLAGARNQSSFEKKINAAYAAFYKKISKYSDQDFDAQLWLRFLAIEEKIGMISQPKTPYCPAIISLSEYFEKVMQEEHIKPKLSKHIAQCSFCASLIQLLIECYAIYTNSEVQPAAPKAFVKQSHKKFKDRPMQPPSLSLIMNKNTLALEKSNLDTSMDGFSDWYTGFFSPLQSSDSLAVFHRNNDILFRLVCYKNGRHFNMEASGINATKEDFPGTFVLVDESGNILPQKFNEKSAVFEDLPQGTYSLSILRPSKKGVIEIESVQISAAMN